MLRSGLTFLQQGISAPVFYGDLVYKFKSIVGKHSFGDQSKKIIKRYKRETTWISCDSLHAWFKAMFFSFRAIAGYTSHIKIFLILCTQLVLCMDCQFMKLKVYVTALDFS